MRTDACGDRPITPNSYIAEESNGKLLSNVLIFFMQLASFELATSTVDLVMLHVQSKTRVRAYSV